MSQSNAPFSDHAVLSHLMSTFPARLEEKFREGMKKYASPLTAKNCLDEAFPEVMDLVVYLTAERMKQRLLYQTLLSAEAFLVEGKSDKAIVLVGSAIELVQPRPLAVKVSHKTSSPEATS